MAVDVLGLVIAVLAASAHDNAAGIALLDKVAADTVTAQKALVEQGFKTVVVDHGKKVGIDVEVVERNPTTSGFLPQPIRWRVEQVNRIVMPHRMRPAPHGAALDWAGLDLAGLGWAPQGAPVAPARTRNWPPAHCPALRTYPPREQLRRATNGSRVRPSRWTWPWPRSQGRAWRLPRPATAGKRSRRQVC